MEKKQPAFTFTVTLDELLALRQSLDNLEQTIIRSRDVQIRTLELLKKWGYTNRCAICGKWGSDDDFVKCEDCSRRCCQECVKTDYRNFSYYNGNVDIVSVCRAECTSE